jgi:hypothetical protein
MPRPARRPRTMPLNGLPGRRAMLVRLSGRAVGVAALWIKRGPPPAAAPALAHAWATRFWEVQSWPLVRAGSWRRIALGRPQVRAARPVVDDPQFCAQIATLGLAALAVRLASNSGAKADIAGGPRWAGRDIGAPEGNRKAPSEPHLLGPTRLLSTRSIGVWRPPLLLAAAADH